MPNSSFADTITDWEKLSVTTDKDDLPHLISLRTELWEIVEGAKAANIRQSAFRAQHQRATRDLEEFMERGRDVSTRVRNGVRMQYGLKGEELTEFGLQPRRKPHKAKAEPTAPSTPPSEIQQGAEPQKADPQK